MTGFITLENVEGRLEMFYAWDARFTQMPPTDDCPNGYVVVTPKIGISFTTLTTLSDIAEKIKKSEEPKV